MNDDPLTRKIIGACIAVHKALGPGLLESAYQNALCLELDRQGLSYEKEVVVTVQYMGVNVGPGFRADIIVENEVLLELKSIEKVAKIHFKQLLTYLKLTRLTKGLLLNFGQERMIEGVHRVVNGA